jgi:hypothetical protein
MPNNRDYRSEVRALGQTASAPLRALRNQARAKLRQSGLTDLELEYQGTISSLSVTGNQFTATCRDDATEALVLQAYLDDLGVVRGGREKTGTN